MAKGGKGFAEKTAKSSRNVKVTCPVCGENIEYVKHIATISDPAKRSMRFKEQIVGVCKCNRDQIYK
ncbi:MAG: hypothetical protein PHC43_03465 [Candidatus Marinimicrobia bacterium]|jgi:C4-type Zn-finger protein|nr:hypothetical protein [Candidatus Neomarinimicrobiota bacterium]MDD5061631.1 hypothetical protein [Candidatus Neomarinimicrobiota bacterium]MDD5230362.1 hypothetical protein [Candidatus Neomarinimicrobiota bacterium]MDD5540478.1 hypothetical protein [Candidatus Neomarinimicrobiota bacterium]